MRRASVGDLDTVFAQRANLLSPSFLRMVYDVVRFGREAPKVRAARAAQRAQHGPYAARRRSGRSARSAAAPHAACAAARRLSRKLRLHSLALPPPALSKVLEPPAAAAHRDVTLAQYLERNGYSAAFRRHYLLPMCAAVWSVPNEQVLAFPVQMLVRFWVNHHLLDLTQRPKWRVVKGRSKSYVDAVLAGAHTPACFGEGRSLHCRTRARW